MIQHNHIITYAYFLFFQYKIQVGTIHHNLRQHYILFDRCQARWNFWSGVGRGDDLRPEQAGQRAFTAVR